jgi:hypothetical protein
MKKQKKKYLKPCMKVVAIKTERPLADSDPVLKYNTSGGKVNKNYDALSKSRGTRDADDYENLW